MDTKEFLIYLLIMAGVTYLIRVIPFVAFKNTIQNKFIKSFLYYIPYTVLAAMTFPAVLYASEYYWSSFAGFVTAIVFAYRGASLTKVAMAACIAVFVVEKIILL